MTALSTIRKAVGAGVGALVTGGYTVLQADGFHLASVSQGQVSTVLFGALATGVTVFGVKNKTVEAVITDVEHVIADKGAAVVTPALVGLSPALDQLAASLAAVPAVPGELVDVAAGAHAAPDVAPSI